MIILLKESYIVIMSKEYQHILEGALTLPRNELFALMQAILAKIQDDTNLMNETQDIKMFWEIDDLFRELDRRVEEVRSGKVKPIPGNEVMTKLKKRFG